MRPMLAAYIRDLQMEEQLDGIATRLQAPIRRFSTVAELLSPESHPQHALILGAGRDVAEMVIRTYQLHDLYQREYAAAPPLVIVLPEELRRACPSLGGWTIGGRCPYSFFMVASAEPRFGDDLCRVVQWLARQEAGG